MSFLGIVTLVLVALIILSLLFVFFKAFILLLPVGWSFGSQVREIKIVYQPVKHIMIGLELMNLLKKVQENGLVM